MTTSPASLSGPEVRDLFAAGMTWLGRHVEKVNSLNVFPVPDGDTGTNMFLTMRSTLEEAQKCDDPSAGAMLEAISHGALMGGRGNSGVLLSAIIRGFAAAHRGRPTLDCASLADGLEAGVAAAVKALKEPAEGTILTVTRDVSRAVRAEVENGATRLTPVIATALAEAQASVDRTPSLLPKLAEAGVVDAGGLGFAYILDGMLRHLRGESLEAPLSEEKASISEEWLTVTEQRHATERSLYGWCAEVLVSGSSLDSDLIRQQVFELGDSVLVVGDDNLVRIHVHTDVPGDVITHGWSLGTLTQIKVDNILSQAERFVAMHQDRLGRLIVGPDTVAVVAGDGMAAVFTTAGCTRTVSGGPTMNPSTGDIVKAAEACPAEDVVILPNDKNIILAAQEAAKVTQKRIHVVPSRSMPQGIAALLAADHQGDLSARLSAMNDALKSVHTIEATRAVRSSSIKGVRVRAGQAIAIVDDDLKLAAPTAADAVLTALPGVLKEGTDLITVFGGADISKHEADGLAKAIRELVPPGAEVHVHYGGQPHYDYIVSVEYLPVE